MNIKRAALVIACAVVAGCGAADNSPARQAVQQDPPETFRFVGRAEPSERNGGDPQGERARIRELEGHLRNNRMCLTGYTITSRRVVIQMGQMDQVQYYGRCRD